MIQSSAFTKGRWVSQTKNIRPQYFVLGLTKKPLSTATLAKHIQRVHSQIPPRLSLFTGIREQCSLFFKKIHL